MIITSLVKQYEILAANEELPKQGWGMEKVSYGLNLSQTGELLDIITLLAPTSRGKKLVDLPKDMEVPERVVRASNVVANFLCDNGGYFLAIDRKGKPSRTAETFMASKALHHTILQIVDSPTAKAISAFFENWEIENAREDARLSEFIETLEAGVNLIFMVEGFFAQEDPLIRKAWESYLLTGEKVLQARCLVTGEVLPVARLHGKIKGIPNAQPAGANLISVNAESFISYGLGEGMPCAPVSEYATFAYVTVLNHMLQGTSHKQQIGDTTLLFWAEKCDRAAEELMTNFMFPPFDADSIVGEIYKKVAAGQMSNDISFEQTFFVMGVSPNAARLSVRFFYKDTLGKMLQNIRKHYDRIEIAKAPYEKDYLSPWQLMYEIVNTKSTDKNPPSVMLTGLMQAILHGSRYPYGLYQAVLMRIRAEQDNKEKHVSKVSRGRAAIIKACLHQYLQSDEERQVLTVALNENTKNLPYVLGRLFSTLEQVQQAANPDINTTIKDRFFNSACTTPGVVFPQLIKLSQNHIAKAKYGGFYEKKIGELINCMEIEENPFPANLTLNEQGLFILGYYQQNQARYIKKEDV